MTAKIALFIRVANRRVVAGEDLETILAGWPKLTDEEKQLIARSTTSPLNLSSFGTASLSLRSRPGEIRK